MTSIIQFNKEIKKEADLFMEYWLENFEKDKDTFPLEIDANNDGDWLELFLSWRENG